MTLRTRSALALILLAGGIALAWSTLPLTLPVTCPFRRITGLPCPSCGLTHATCALVHGQFRQATRFNLAAIPLALLALPAIIALLIELFTNRPCLTPLWKRFHRPLTALIILLLITAWIFHFLPPPI